MTYERISTLKNRFWHINIHKISFVNSKWSRLWIPPWCLDIILLVLSKFCIASKTDIVHMIFEFTIVNCFILPNCFKQLRLATFEYTSFLIHSTLQRSWQSSARYQVLVLVPINDGLVEWMTCQTILLFISFLASLFMVSL